jgi:DNA-binding transcriptional LysR family regulator
MRVYEARNFPRVVQELDVAQSTVSTSVAYRGKNLQVTRFQRSTWASSPSDAAATF